MIFQKKSKDQTSQKMPVSQRQSRTVLEDNRETTQLKIQPVQRNNTGLPDNLKSGMENLSGMSLDHVRVHYNSAKPAAVQAHAYAQGTDIHLASGQEKHLPHELGHVVQQAQGIVQATTSVSGMAVNDNSGLESEATAMGDKALQRVLKGRVGEKSTSLTPSIMGAKTLNTSNSVQRVAVPTFSYVSSTSPVQMVRLENVAVTGLSHLVKMKDGSIYEADEGEEIIHGEQVVIDHDERYRSRRGPNQETYRDEDRSGPHHYYWYRVLSVDGKVVNNRFIRSDVFVPIERGSSHDSANLAVMNLYHEGGAEAIKGLAQIQAKAGKEKDEGASRYLKWWYSEINGNMRTTPEAGYPALLTVYGDAASGVSGIHAHVQGRGNQLQSEARAEASKPSSTFDPNLKNASLHATGIADSIALFGDSYQGIKSVYNYTQAKTVSEKHRAKSKAKSAGAGVGIAALNSAKYFATVAGSVVGGVIGAVASFASYCRSIGQMLVAEGQYLDLSHIELKGNHKRLGDLMTYAKGKKFRRTAKKGIATAGAALSTGLGAGSIAALAIGGTAAVAALAVTPVGLALGVIALVIGLGLAAYKIYRFGKRKLEGRTTEREKWAEYIHEKVNSSPNFLQKDAKYKKEVCTQVIRALGLTPEKCAGSAGLKNIMDALQS